MSWVEFSVDGIDGTKNYKDTLFVYTVENTKYTFTVESLSQINCDIKLESPKKYKGKRFCARFPTLVLFVGFSFINRKTSLMKGICMRKLCDSIEYWHYDRGNISHIVDELHNMKGWRELLEDIEHKKNELAQCTIYDEERHQKRVYREIGNLIREHYKKVYEGSNAKGLNSGFLTKLIDDMIPRFL